MYSHSKQQFWIAIKTFTSRRSISEPGIRNQGSRALVPANFHTRSYWTTIVGRRLYTNNLPTGNNTSGKIEEQSQSVIISGNAVKITFNRQTGWIQQYQRTKTCWMCNMQYIAISGAHPMTMTLVLACKPNWKHGKLLLENHSCSHSILFLKNNLVVVKAVYNLPEVFCAVAAGIQDQRAGEISDQQLIATLLKQRCCPVWYAMDLIERFYHYRVLWS